MNTQKQQVSTSIKSSFTPTPAGLLQRKCACGNHTMGGGECAECSKKKQPRLQTKLKVSEPGDSYEREADRVADQVMAMPAYDGVPPRIQRFAGQSNGQVDAAPASVDRVLASPGRALEPALRQDMEQRFGYGFSGVRVHTGAAAEQSARDVNAHAYTVGHNIVFGASRFAPGTQEGQRLLAYELAHVAQQGYSIRMLQRSPRRRGRSRDKLTIIDPKTARLVMELIMTIIAKIEANPTHPSRWASDPSISKYRELLSLWFELTYGKRADGSKLEGEEFASAFERADAETVPIFQASLQGATEQFLQTVSRSWYPNFFELENRAASEKHIVKLVETTTTFTLASSPVPISFDEFLRVASANNSQSPILQRGSGIKVGRVVAGFAYYASANEPRLVLWASSEGVFFLLDDQIYKQSIAGFSDDIILGAIIKAAQDVAPFVNLITAVVDIAISLTPVGTVYDLMMASKAIAEGNWRDAALELLPGPALNKATKLAKATRIGRAAFRGGAKGAKLLGEAISGTATFVGRGIGKVRGKLSRGLWLVQEGAGAAGGRKAYYFLDEAEDVWRAVPETEAQAFIRCSKCDLTNRGKATSVEQKLEEEIKEIGGFQHAFEGPLGDIVSDPKEAGTLFNELNLPKSAHREVTVRARSGRRPRVDIYVKGEAIISRKLPMGQLAEDELKALDYLQELRVKYPPGAPIRSKALKGEALEGFQILQVPKQTMDIPKRVLEYAKSNRILICDIDGNIYNFKELFVLP